jgi:hypothetical protein
MNGLPVDQINYAITLYTNGVPVESIAKTLYTNTRTIYKHIKDRKIPRCKKHLYNERILRFMDMWNDDVAPIVMANVLNTTTTALSRRAHYYRSLGMPFKIRKAGRPNGDMVY